MLTGVRGVGKTTTARILARGLNYETEDGVGGADRRSLRRGRALPRHHGGPASRRDRDGRRLAYRHRRHPRHHRFGALLAGLGALQGLHHRRSAHALEAGLQRPPEDAGGAAGACEVRLRHDRDPQGAGDGAVALPALRPAPRRGRRADRRISRRSRRRKASRPSREALRQIARAAEGSVRDALSHPRPGDRAWRRQGRGGRRCRTCSASPTGRASSTSSSM